MALVRNIVAQSLRRVTRAVEARHRAGRNLYVKYKCTHSAIS